MSTVEGLPQTRDFFLESPHGQSFGRSFDDVKMKEEDSLNLEDKPRLPPYAPKGIGRKSYESLDEKISAKPDQFPSKMYIKKEQENLKPCYKKLKAPDSDEGDYPPKKQDRAVSRILAVIKYEADRSFHGSDQDASGGGWQLDQLEWSFYWKELTTLLPLISS